MDLHDQVPVLIFHVLEANVPKDAGIVDQDIDPPKSLDGRLNDLFPMLDAVIIRSSLAAGSFDLVNDDIGSLSEGWKISGMGSLRPGLTFVDWPSPLKEPPRSFTTTFAPLDPKKTAYAFPSPPPAPVMTTVCPSKRNSDMMTRKQRLFNELPQAPHTTDTYDDTRLGGK